MTHGPPPLARWLACSALLLGLSLTGTGCRDNPPPAPPPARELPDAERSSVEVNPAQGARANGKDSVDIRVTVLKADGSPLAGRAGGGEDGDGLGGGRGRRRDAGVASLRRVRPGVGRPAGLHLGAWFRHGGGAPGGAWGGSAAQGG